MAQKATDFEGPVPPSMLRRDDDSLEKQILASLSRLESGQHLFHAELLKRMGSVESDVAVLRERVEGGRALASRVEVIAGEITVLRLAVKDVEEVQELRATVGALQLTMQDLKTRLVLLGVVAVAIMSAGMTLVIDWIKGR